ncbi:MAG: hypothetical protein ABJN84_09310 [Flavobacteriaceae bacterium]
MKKHYFHKFLYLISILAIGLTLFYHFKAKDLENQLLTIESEQTEQPQNTVIDYNELTEIDALIIDGDDYTEALQAYQEKYQEHLAEEETALELRIALTQKMMALRTRANQDMEKQGLQHQVDSLIALQEVAPRALQQYDSLNFAMEKAKVQIAMMQKRLRNNSSGEYLTFTNSKGSQMHYVGQVKHGKANGFGVAILSTGSRYVGDWKDNQRHGEGSFYWADGQYYAGHYVNDKRSGKGSYHWPNGEKFVGFWKADERAGEGAFYGKKGDLVASGVWNHDELVATNKP